MKTLITNIHVFFEHSLCLSFGFFRGIVYIIDDTAGAPQAFLLLQVVWDGNMCRSHEILSVLGGELGQGLVATESLSLPPALPGAGGPWASYSLE